MARVLGKSRLWPTLRRTAVSRNVDMVDGYFHDNSDFSGVRASQNGGGNPTFHFRHPNDPEEYR